MATRDQTKTEMISTLKNFRDKKLAEKNPDFMVLIILGHGRYNSDRKKEEILDINNRGISLDAILEMFLNADRCPSMANKPKLIYIQACRGNNFQKYLSNGQLSEQVTENTDDSVQFDDLTISEDVTDGRNSYFPDWSDKVKQVSWYHIVYSTIKGYCSVRHGEKGSYFIQTLCEVLNDTGSSECKHYILECDK